MIADALAALVAALEGEGLRVAIRSGDLTPPCVYVQIGGATDTDVPLSGGLATTFWVYWIPIRGVENLAADADALDSIFWALSPLSLATLTVTRTSMTVSNDTWPGYRADAQILAVPDPVEAR